MIKFENEFEKFAYEYYKDEIIGIDKIIEIKHHERAIRKHKLAIKNLEIELINQKTEYLKKSNQEYKKQIEKLNELDDLNTPEARKILDELILMVENQYNI